MTQSTEVPAGRRPGTTPGAGTTRGPRGETRQRILDTALRHFAEHGYAGTSVRDIADELGLTKAAVHYHFAAKEQIVVALLGPMMARLSDVVEGAAATPTSPRDLLLGLRDVLVASGPLLSVLASDPSVAKPSPEMHAELQALAARTAQVMAGPDAGPPGVLRAHCALGAFFAGWDTACRTGTGPAPGVVGDDDLEVLLAAALAALGHEG